MPRQAEFYLRDFENVLLKSKKAASWARSLGGSEWRRLDLKMKTLYKSSEGVYLYWIKTASHGGFVLITPTRLVPEKLRSRHVSLLSASPFNEEYGGYTFEEDVEWAVLLYYYPDLIPCVQKIAEEPIEREQIMAIMNRYFKDLL